MRTFIYQNKGNLNKYITVRRYKDGHYVWKQYIQTYVSTSSTVINYTGCSLKRSGVGTWHRVSKQTRDAVLQDYVRVA